jgi:hypothetical protein
MNLSDIMQAAQGGQGINHIAQQFGISPEQAQAAINAMLPGLSQGLQNQASSPGGLGAILGHLVDATHQQAYTDAAAAASPATTQAGGNVLGQVLGNGGIAGQLAQHAAKSTGLSPEVIQSMMPVVASMVIGGLFHNANNQGLGGMLGQLAGQGGNLGQTLGQAMGQSQPTSGGGGLGGMLGGLVGGLFGGGGSAQTPGGLNPALVQAGISALTNMLNHGVQVPAGQQAGLQDILGQLMAGAKR